MSSLRKQEDATRGKCRLAQAIPSLRGAERRSNPGSRHTPRKRGIQFAETYQFLTIVSGILDHPLSRMMTEKSAGSLCGACHRAALCADPLARDDGYCS